MGWTQWATAAERPPHLKCMVSTSAAGRWQQEIPYTSGVFQLYFGWWMYLVRRRIAESHGIALVDWDEVLRRLPLDEIATFMAPAGQTRRGLLDPDTLGELSSGVGLDGRSARMLDPF